MEINGNLALVVDNSYNDNTHFVNRFLNSYPSEHTRRNYDRTIKEFFNVKDITDITLRSLNNISLSQIEQYIYKMYTNKKSSATIENRISALRSFYKKIVNYQCYDINPVNPFENQNIKDLLKRHTEKKVEKLTGTALSEEQVDALLYTAKTKNKRDYLLLRLLFVTGMRRSEVINVRWNDFNYDASSNKWFLTIRGKGKKTRKNGIKNEVIELLRGHFEYKLGEIGTSDEKLFPMTSDNVLKIVSRYGKAIGMDITPHDCRRTVITNLVMNNCSAFAIKSFMGHASIETTYGYIREVKGKMNDASDYITL